MSSLIRSRSRSSAPPARMLECLRLLWTDLLGMLELEPQKGDDPMNRSNRSIRPAFQILGVLLCCAALAPNALGQDTVWNTYNDAGMQALKVAQYAKAERMLKLALREAELSGLSDTRVATSLNNLALLYGDQGKYDQAEPLYKRSLAISEKAFGPGHPNVATSLENLAVLLVATGRRAEADRLLKRATAIRSGKKE